jgi:hypothetical protein
MGPAAVVPFVDDVDEGDDGRVRAAQGLCPFDPTRGTLRSPAAPSLQRPHAGSLRSPAAPSTSRGVAALPAKRLCFIDGAAVAWQLLLRARRKRGASARRERSMRRPTAPTAAA